MGLEWEREEMTQVLSDLHHPTRATPEERDGFSLPVSGSIPGNSCDNPGQVLQPRLSQSLWSEE